MGPLRKGSKLRGAKQGHKIKINETQTKSDSIDFCAEITEVMPKILKSILHFFYFDKYEIHRPVDTYLPYTHW